MRGAEAGPDEEERHAGGCPPGNATPTRKIPHVRSPVVSPYAATKPFRPPPQTPPIVVDATRFLARNHWGGLCFRRQAAGVSRCCLRIGEGPIYGGVETCQHHIFGRILTDNSTASRPGKAEINRIFTLDRPSGCSGAGSRHEHRPTTSCGCRPQKISGPAGISYRLYASCDCIHLFIAFQRNPGELRDER